MASRTGRKSSATRKREGHATPVHTGGCLCGAVRFRATGKPTLVENCHCSMCRKASGAAMVTSANFPSDSFRWTKGKLKYYRSSATGRRGFCARCGSQLTFHRIGRRGEVSINVGSLDRPERVKPWLHIYAADAVPWMLTKDGLPRYARGIPK
ncbi:MAG: GFA family protein [Alphaproteobacteria bacterium]